MKQFNTLSELAIHTEREHLKKLRIIMQPIIDDLFREFLKSEGIPFEEKDMTKVKWISPVIDQIKP